MNAKLIVSLIVALLAVTASRADDNWDQIHLAELDATTVKPYRKIGDNVFDLTPRFYYARDNQLFTSQPLPQFEFIHGRIVSVGEDGILLRRYAESDIALTDSYKLIYVRNYPFQAVDNQRVALYAIESGTYAYLSAGNARSTVTCFDFGKKPSEIEIAQAKDKARERSENYQKAITAQKAANDLIQSKKDQQGKVAAIKFLQEKAAEGAPMSQYRLAEKYLKGDGVPIDIEQAKFWLQASCTNGYSEASNLLQKIQVESLAVALAAEHSRTNVEAIAKRNIAVMPARMDGAIIRITDYEDEASLRRINARIKLSLADHRRINQLMATEIQNRGGRVENVKINADDYFAWLKQNHRTNSVENVGAYAQTIRAQ